MSALLALAPPVPRAELPAGAVARLGSPEWRNMADTRSVVTFTSDGKGVVIAHGQTLRAIDFQTGRELWKVSEIGYDPRGAAVPGGKVLLHSNGLLRLFNAADGLEEKA